MLSWVLDRLGLDFSFCVRLLLLVPLEIFSGQDASIILVEEDRCLGSRVGFVTLISDNDLDLFRLTPRLGLDGSALGDLEACRGFDLEEDLSPFFFEDRPRFSPLLSSLSRLDELLLLERCWLFFFGFGASSLSSES